MFKMSAKLSYVLAKIIMSLRYTRHVFQLNFADILNISLSNTAGELQSPKVRKKASSIRFAIDLLLLNHYTVKDLYFLPRIDDTLDALSGAKWYSTLDLKAVIKGLTSINSVFYHFSPTNIS
jgi:hypothetical protein